MQSSMARPYPLLLAVAVTLFITHSVAHAQVNKTVTLAAGQIGRIAFETTTMTDLTGRAPAVVLLHGTVGAGPREERWAAELNRLGVGTFVLDSFSGRGLAPPFESGAVPSPLTIIVDAYRARMCTYQFRPL